MDCYIYYKAPIEHAKQIQDCFAYLQDHLLMLVRKPQLQRRPEASNSLDTWMEIYRDIPGNFEEIIAEATKKSGIYKVLVGERRLEYFINVSL
jgi:hypothetical protein